MSEVNNQGMKSSNIGKLDWLHEKKEAYEHLGHNGV